MIDLVLENSRVPAGGIDHYRLGLLVEAFDLYRCSTPNQRCKSRHAQASLKELHYFLDYCELGVDHNMKRHRRSTPLGKQLLRKIPRILSSILNYGKL